MAANEGKEDAMRFRNGLPADASRDDKLAFANYCLGNYQQQEWSGSSLSEYFAEDFASFTIEDFKQVESDTRKNLRDLLRERGVYVPKGRNRPIANSLFTIVREEIPWPDDDSEKPVVENHTLTHTFMRQEGLQSRQEPTGDPLEDHLSQHDEIEKATAVPEISNPRFVPQWKKSNMANLFKAYSSDGDKYNGSTMDNFDRKFLLFLERCEQADVAEDDRHRAFSIMLTGHARQFYFDHLKREKLTLGELENAVRKRFMTPERTRALLREWDSISLTHVLDNNPEKSSSSCLEVMIERLSDIQSSLPVEYRNETILRNKLLNAIRDVDSCQFAYQKPADTVQGVISDLHASLATAKRRATGPNIPMEPNAHFIDRRIMRRNGTKYDNRSRSKTCFVCGKLNCWSTKHTPHERLQAYRKNKSIRQFMVSLYNDHTVDNEDEETADALDDIAAHFIVLDDPHGNDESSFSDVDEKGFSHLATIEDANGSAAFTAELQDNAFMHATTASKPPQRFGKNFDGVMVDTGAARGSSAGMVQYQAYCQFVGKSQNVDASRAAVCHFGIGSATSLGIASISFPIKNIWLSFEVHIVNADTPILLSIDDMDRLGIYLNNLKNEVVHPQSGMTTLITRVRGHPFIQWDRHFSCYFTTSELRRLHRRFGHPSTDKLLNLLERSNVDSIDSETRSVLKSIERSCGACQFHAQKPHRFKFSLREDKDFNHTVYADIFYIESKPVLHIVDEATNFQAARWLPDMSSESLWTALRMCWIDVYLGPPDIVVHDAGKNFMGSAFQSNTDMLHIRTKSVPVESANSMTVVERYHAPIRRAFSIIRAEAPDLPKEEALQMAVKSINDSTGPNGLVPTLLVFGALPRLGLPNDTPTPSTFKRAVALRKATAAMQKHFASRQVKAALNTRNGPDVTEIHATPIGAPVLVYRIERDKWEGPFSLLDIRGEDVFVLTQKGAQKFRSTVVKPYIVPSENDIQANLSGPPLQQTSFVTASRVVKVSTKARFERSRQSEFNRLLERKVFTLVPESEAKGIRVYGSRFVDTIKHEGKPEAFEKSRLVVQAYNDNQHGFLTHAPTVQRVSQRLLLTLCAMDFELSFFTRDVSQAYVQSKTATQRPIYVRPPESLMLPANKLLRVERPLYGIPEAGLHWYRTYHNYHQKKLSLMPSVHDPCFLYTTHGMSSNTRNTSNARGFTCLQTDDTASAGNNRFIKLEVEMASNFDCKPPVFLADGKKLVFNGAQIGQVAESYFITQPDQIQKLKEVSESNVDKAEFVAQRARGAYIAAVGRPDLTFGFAQASQVVVPDQATAKTLNMYIQRAKENHEFRLCFVSLDKTSVKLAVFADASFASNADLTSQLGYVIVLADADGNANILHYTSLKSKRVTRSVLTAELFAAVHAFDYASTLRATLNEVFGRVVPLILYTDSKSLFDSIIGLNSTTEKRLLIDLRMLRQNYELRELNEIVWIPSAQNPADALTKQNPSNALATLLQTNKVSVDAKLWIDRPAQQLRGGKITKA